MQAYPPRRQPIIHVLAAITLIWGCKKEPAPAPHDAAVAVAVTRDAAVDAAATVDAATENRITIGVAKPRVPGEALAKRCLLGGDPLPTSCSGGSEGIAVGRDGTLYIAVDKTVRRYRRGTGEGCVYEPSGEPIELPADNPRPQKLGGGPIHMRSGGAAWSLVRSGDVVFAHDFLGGLFRIDRGKAEPACLDVFGYRRVAVRGKQLLVVSSGIKQLVLGKAGACKAVSVKVDDKARGEVFVIADRIYTSFGSSLLRYEGTTPTKLGEGTRMCSVVGVTGCGDGACVLDTNCMQVLQLDVDGKVVRSIEERKLFSARPWRLAEAITIEDGSVLLRATHRDKVGGADVCEAALYELPPALFAR